MQWLRSCANGMPVPITFKGSTRQGRKVKRKPPALPALLHRTGNRRPLHSLSLGEGKVREVGRENVVPSGAVSFGVTQVGVQWLLGIGVFVFCFTASVFLIAALSTLREVAFAARRVTIVMKLLELEMPETLAAMRLSSIEISDCIEEFTGLGQVSSLHKTTAASVDRSDLASGLRSSANMMSAAEKGVQQGTQMVRGALLPALRSKGPEVKNALEKILKERAMLRENNVLTESLSMQTSHRLKALRRGVATVGMGIKAATLWRAVRPPFSPPDDNADTDRS